MTRLGGMTADGALVVIEGQGVRWRVLDHSIEPAAWRASIERPAFPIVLDHRTWEGEDPLARALLGAGWDVRPPRCERGEACPAPAMGRGDLGDAIYWDLVEDVPAACQEALACYAITHLGEEDANDSLPSASCTVIRPARCANCHGLVEGADCPACGPP